MAGSAREKCKNPILDSSLILFSMWTEAVKNFAEQGKGNVIFFRWKCRRKWINHETK
jgi:hypothetical protein